MRLIDGDKLYRTVKLAWDTEDSEDFEKSVFTAIASAPTIDIPTDVAIIVHEDGTVSRIIGVNI